MYKYACMCEVRETISFGIEPEITQMSINTRLCDKFEKKYSNTHKHNTYMQQHS